jgi:NAD(P)-dependent dehydrogenase (short-subunit alcohol dehydrogenase family)
MTSPITVVTGANSGIGRATAIHLAVNGHRVFGTVRAVAKAEKLLAAAAEQGVEIELAELDVADDASVERGFADILDRAGRIDHLVNNAGVGGNGVVEECSSEQFLEVMNVDLVGAIRCSRAVLPQMRERGSGTIVNVTSVAGRFGAMAQAPYVASKWALEGVSEEMALELAAFGIRVAIVEPGVTKSSIFAKNIDAPNNTGAYDAHYRRMFQMYAAGIQNATDAIEVAEVIRHAIETDQPELRYLVSWGAAEMVAGRDAMSAADWVGLGALADDADYAQRFSEIMGIDITGV